MTSLKTPTKSFSFLAHFTGSISMSNYKAAFEAIPFTRYMMNTFLICALNIIGQLFSAPLVAYSISRFRGAGGTHLLDRGRTMILPAQCR